jgi:flagellar basal body-associated protein FliL
MTLSLKVSSGLLWIIVVLVIVFVSFFCCGTAVFCFFKHRAKQMEANKKATGTVEIVKNDPNLVSEMELRPQYHPNEDLDFDIFANKKRDFKMNDDDVYNTEQSSINNLVSSDKKLISSTAPDVNNNMEV